MAVRRLVVGVIGIAAFGFVGALAALHRPGESAAAALPPLIGAAVGIPLLVLLLRPTERSRLGDARAVAQCHSVGIVAGSWSSTGSAAAAAVVAGGIAEIVERRRVATIREAIPDTLPQVFDPGGAGIAVPAEATVSPITPFITPNDDFYRIDTALSFPRINVSSWKVDIGGMVDRPLTLTYDDLLARPQVERVVTLVLRLERGRRRVHLAPLRSRA